MKNLNKNIEVFFIDLDGTLLDGKAPNGKHTISEKNINAIKEISKTKDVVISTGRMGSSVEGYMKDTGVKYAVCANGALVIDNKGKVYKDDKLTVRQVILLVDFAKKHKLSFKVDAIPEAFGARGFFAKKIAAHNGFATRDHYNLDVHKQYYKMVLWGKLKCKNDKIIKMIEKEIDGVSIVTSANGWTIEVTNEKSTKGLGNMKVAKLLKIEDKKKLLHIGDTMNDSTTVPYMRLVAMGNAKKNLKEMTLFHGPTYKNGGVAEIINGNYTKDVPKKKSKKQAH